ncbi:MAG TPA: O-antigen ligase family protein [Devosiaceae bacterium]|jgi:hypothetical protein|nr:O-antigen ligase family protein [Devosiaceae bacterium]
MALAIYSEEFAALQRARGRAYVAKGLKTWLDRTVSLWIFMGGMVIIEPSPYEFLFAIVLPLSLFAGLKIYRPTAVLFLLAAAFTPFALAAAFQATYTPTLNALIYEATTIFLMLTAFFAASYVAEAPQERMRRIMRAYTAIAVLSAILGTLGYLHLIPGAYDILTRYSRAKAFFQDPNVFAPFLILPAIYAAQRLLLARGWRVVLIDGSVVMILLIGVFVSFSRAAWGNLLGSGVLLFLLVMIFEATARDKIRMIVLGMAGVVLAITAILGLLSIPSVNALFEERAAVEQSYDSGATGRFGRQGYAFDLGLSHPLGIGPAEFRNLEIPEEAHDSFATTLHVYGWGGALIWDVLIVMTLGRGFGALLRPSPNRRMLIPLLAVYLPLVIQAGIIDIDHWRHYYLIIGLIWGVTTGYGRLAAGENRRTALI